MDNAIAIRNPTTSVRFCTDTQLQKPPTTGRTNQRPLIPSCTFSGISFYLSLTQSMEHFGSKGFGETLHLDQHCRNGQDNDEERSRLRTSRGCRRATHAPLFCHHLFDHNCAKGSIFTCVNNHDFHCIFRNV